MRLHRQLSMEELSADDLALFESIVQSLHLVEPSEDPRVACDDELHTLALSMLRKRKRKDVDDDSLSVQSLDVVREGEDGNEKKNKRRSMVKMSSLFNILSPAAGRKGKTLERSFSFKAPSSPATAVAQPTHRQITPYKKPKPACADRRSSRFWSETVGLDLRARFSAEEIKRQEAIHELVEGEQDLIQDLSMVHKLYYNSMKQLKLLTEEELDNIFGIVERLVPFHEDLLSSLRSLRKSDGTTDQIGDRFLQWVPNLKHYETYCANQVFAKGLLDYKKTDPKVDDFLTRCQESSFSRKLDLWNFLDLPRSRLVKYPLLLKEVYKYTADGHSDRETIPRVLEQLEAIIDDVDVRIGESECKHMLSSLHYLYDSQRSELIDQSTAVICSGQLKNDRGTKLHVVLFDKVLVVTRQATRNNTMKYQLVKDPIPIAHLDFTDLSESEGKKGSFKNKVLRNPLTDKYAFRVFSRDSSQSHTLYARDEHDKRQWLTSLQSALEKSNARPVPETDNSKAPLADDPDIDTEKTSREEPTEILSIRPHETSV
ncbi:rho guanine nucleotide exchange factor 3-like isoform X2 [Watersipora subatra]|uniref:rho guanine nucleotide exchange factor 3-like isoform X2 n=1 Tax=Watersipora subatra TaxID=2589382 RepID=UPI00355B3364